MSNFLTDIDDFADGEENNLLTPEEIQAAEEARQARQSGRRGMRSNADEILDAVEGQQRRAARGRPTECPECGGELVRRGPGVGSGVITLKCRPCNIEIPLGGNVDRTEGRPLPIEPMALGPYYGEGGPPIDRHQPIHRQLSEYIRRATDHEP